MTATVTRTYRVTHEDGRAHNVEGVDVSAAITEAQCWSDSPVETVEAVQVKLLALYPCGCGHRFVPATVREVLSVVTDGALAFNCPNCGASHIVWREEN